MSKPIKNDPATYHKAGTGPYKKGVAPLNPERLAALDASKQRLATLQDSLVTDGTRFFANDNISQYLNPDLMQDMSDVARHHMECLLDALMIDWRNDHNSQGTPERFIRMLLEETFSGRYEEQPRVTNFDNASGYDQIYVVGPIRITSTCSHHWQNIDGTVWIGIHPNKNKVIGLSKLSRIANWICNRPSIQEESTEMLADQLEKVLEPQGLAVIMHAQHDCCSVRGINDPNLRMTTSVMRGTFMTSSDTRKELMDLISMGQKS